MLLSSISFIENNNKFFYELIEYNKYAVFDEFFKFISFNEVPDLSDKVYVGTPGYPISDLELNQDLLYFLYGSDSYEMKVDVNNSKEVIKSIYSFISSAKDYNFKKIVIHKDLCFMYNLYYESLCDYNVIYLNKYNMIDYYNHVTMNDIPTEYFINKLILKLELINKYSKNTNKNFIQDIVDGLRHGISVK